MTAKMCELQPGLFAHASGGAWLGEHLALLVADLHLGYAWAQRRRGELGPLTDGDIAARLLAVVDELQPREIVVLGDLVHARRPSPAEREVIAGLVGRLRERAALRVVAGNHDRGLAADFGIVAERAWRQGRFLAIHGDDPAEAGPGSGYHAVIGHWHPTVTLRDAAGARIRCRAFLSSAGATVLPAFSPFARGADVGRRWPAGLAKAIGEAPVRVLAAGGRTLVPLPFRVPPSGGRR